MHCSTVWVNGWVCTKLWFCCFISHDVKKENTSLLQVDIGKVTFVAVAYTDADTLKACSQHGRWLCILMSHSCGPCSNSSLTTESCRFLMHWCYFLYIVWHMWCVHISESSVFSNFSENPVNEALPAKKTYCHFVPVASVILGWTQKLLHIKVMKRTSWVGIFKTIYIWLSFVAREGSDDKLPQVMSLEATWMEAEDQRKCQKWIWKFESVCENMLEFCHESQVPCL